MAYPVGHLNNELVRESAGFLKRPDRAKSSLEPLADAFGRRATVGEIRNLLEWRNPETAELVAAVPHPNNKRYFRERERVYPHLAAKVIDSALTSGQIDSVQAKELRSLVSKPKTEAPGLFRWSELAARGAQGNTDAATELWTLAHTLLAQQWDAGLSGMGVANGLWEAYTDGAFKSVKKPKVRRVLERILARSKTEENSRYTQARVTAIGLALGVLNKRPEHDALLAPLPAQTIAQQESHEIARSTAYVANAVGAGLMTHAAGAKRVANYADELEKAVQCAALRYLLQDAVEEKFMTPRRAADRLVQCATLFSNEGDSVAAQEFIQRAERTGGLGAAHASTLQALLDKAAGKKDRLLFLYGPLLRITGQLHLAAGGNGLQKTEKLIERFQESNHRNHLTDADALHLADQFLTARGHPTRPFTAH